MVILFIARL